MTDEVAKVYNYFAETLDLADTSEDGKIKGRCPSCGDSESEQFKKSFNVTFGNNPKDPILYHCYRANCPTDGGGMLTVEAMRDELHCHDLEVLFALQIHNKGVKLIKNGKNAHLKKPKGYKLFNLLRPRNEDKLAYINRRLGQSFTRQDLRNLKIQLSIYDFLKINNIKKVPFPPRIMDNIEKYAIGFVSAYDDYIIFRDITINGRLGQRYINYRIDQDDGLLTKSYIMPTELDLLCPEPATLVVAEGIISLLGFTLNSGVEIHTKNVVRTANCGAHFRSTIMNICAAYGLTNIILYIVSDSELKIQYYKALLAELKGNIIIEEMKVFYNTKEEDFGHTKKRMRVGISTLVSKNKQLIKM